MGVIYKIISPSNRIYIGQAMDIKNRFDRYNRLDCKSQRRLYNSFLKYGVDSHKFEIIEICDDEKLNFRERFWQDHYNVLSKKGLNCMLQETVKHRGKMSQETKRKLSEAKKGCVAWNKGLKTNIVPKSARKVKNKITGKVYSSITSASKDIGMKSRTLNAMLTGQTTNKTDIIYLTN